MARGSHVAALILAVSVALVPRQVAAQSNQPVAPMGTEVLVELTNGARLQGRLLSLSASELVIRLRAGETRLPLTQVKTVVRQTHTVHQGALWGMLVGAPAGVMVMTCEPGVNDDCPTKYAGWYLTGGIGAGVGAIAGAIVGLALRPALDRRLLYQSPKKAADIVIAPVLSPGVKGVRIAVRW